MLARLQITLSDCQTALFIPYKFKVIMCFDEMGCSSKISEYGMTIQGRENYEMDGTVFIMYKFDLHLPNTYIGTYIGK